MGVCICMCAYLCAKTQMFAPMYTHKHIHSCLHMHHTYMYKHKDMFICTHTHVHIHEHIYVMQPKMRKRHYYKSHMNILDEITASTWYFGIPC